MHLTQKPNSTHVTVTRERRANTLKWNGAFAGVMNAAARGRIPQISSEGKLVSRKPKRQPLTKRALEMKIAQYRILGQHSGMAFHAELNAIEEAVNNLTYNESMTFPAP